MPQSNSKARLPHRLVLLLALPLTLLIAACDQAVPSTITSNALREIAAEQALHAGAAPVLRSPSWQELSSQAAGSTPELPRLRARSAILVDVASRTVLFARDAHRVIPPASLTKLVAIHAALSAVEAGEISLDARFSPPEAGWASRQPAGSSLMFLEAGQELSLRELLLGLAVSSGNDAAVALAILIDGSVSAFAARMNRNVRELGLVDLSFDEPSGLSPTNSITAYEFARFLVAHTERFPELSAELYSVGEYSYPLASNWVAPEAFPTITQRNRNLLLFELSGVDGFKTGFIEASGYHLAVTANREGRRLVAIVLGIDAPDHITGGRLRADDGAALLEYGFSAFELLSFGLPNPIPVRVFGGTEREVVPERPERIDVSVPRESVELLEGRIRQLTQVTAPSPRALVGEIALELESVQLAAVPLTLPAQEPGGVVRRATDGARRFFAELAGGEPAIDGELLPAVP
ncbi:MAG: D-alanyl-D-alanine carboxypeptidase family protein [Spirochaetales bacterium]